MDTSPTTLFSNYEQDFQQIIASIRGKLEGDPGAEGVGESSSAINMGLVEGLFVGGGRADVRFFLCLLYRTTQDGAEEGGDGIRRG